MEMCGGRTHSIIRFALDEMLPREISLIHGPGCPVGATPIEMIDKAVAIAGRPGVLHGSMTRLLDDEDGQIRPAHSIAAGLDYPAVGPEHSYLAETGRAAYLSATDDEAVAAFEKLARTEGIIPAMETAHALARLPEVAAQVPRNGIGVLCLSGRGDKDAETAEEAIRQKESSGSEVFGAGEGVEP